MRPHIIFRYCGIVLLLNAGFLFISSLVSVYYSDSALLPLAYSGVICTLFGVFPLLFVPSTSNISNMEGYVIVVTCWILSCLTGLLPYVLYGGEFSFTNAWFESVSGFTTTGSTILSSIETLPKGLLFWRSSTHWIGGIGIIIFVLSVLPSMGKVGMTLYRTEMSSLAVENFHFRTKRTLKILLYVYVGLTLAEAVLLMACGMNLFDAVTHAFATIATGGFSPKNLSVAYYNSLPVEIVIMIFMLLSGIHFGLLFFALTGDFSKIGKSTVVRTYVLALLAGTVFVAINIQGTIYPSWAEAFRYSAFQVLSIGTSTGFANADSAVWPAFSQLVIIFFTLQCACAGSTSGGIKVDRIVIFWKATMKRILKMQHPSAVITPKLDRSALGGENIEMSLLYICIYVGIVFLSTVLLAAFGVDSLTAFSGAAATMGNVGPGFGIVGSMGNFSQIPDAGKWILSADMLLGRLEIFGLILIFTAKTWK